MNKNCLCNRDLYTVQSCHRKKKSMRRPIHLPLSSRSKQVAVKASDRLDRDHYVDGPLPTQLLVNDKFHLSTKENLRLVM